MMHYSISEVPERTAYKPRESDDRVASEAGDVIYHLLVGLVLREVSLRDLLSELSRRFGQSGHEEKATR